MRGDDEHEHSSDHSGGEPAGGGVTQGDIRVERAPEPDLQSAIPSRVPRTSGDAIGEDEQ